MQNDGCAADRGLEVLSSCMQRRVPQTAELPMLRGNATGKQMGGNEEEGVVSRMSDGGPWDGSPQLSFPEAKWEFVSPPQLQGWASQNVAQGLKKVLVTDQSALERQDEGCQQSQETVRQSAARPCGSCDAECDRGSAGVDPR